MDFEEWWIKSQGHKLHGESSYEYPMAKRAYEVGSQSERAKIVEMLENLLKTREWYAKVDREYMKEAIQKIKEML